MITSKAQKWIKSCRAAFMRVPPEYRGSVLNTVIFMMRADGDVSIPRKRGPKPRAAQRAEKEAAAKLAAMKVLGGIHLEKAE